MHPDPGSRVEDSMGSILDLAPLSSCIARFGELRCQSSWAWPGFAAGEDALSKGCDGGIEIEEVRGGSAGIIAAEGGMVDQSGEIAELCE